MREKDGCKTSCKYSVELFSLPAGLTFNPSDLSISGVPIQAGTWPFDLCWEDTEDSGCFDNEMSITIKPKKEPAPVRKDCSIKPNPPCGSKQDGGEISPTAGGTLTYESCRCPEGTHDSGGRDAITTLGTVYMICTCD